MVVSVGSKQVTIINKDKAILKVSSVDFGKKSKAVQMLVKGKSAIEVHVDKYDGRLVSTLNANTSVWKTLKTKAAISGVHDLYFVIRGVGLSFDNWKFE